MDALQSDALLTFNSDTLMDVRKSYDLEKSGIMKQSVDLLEDWIGKQSHFRKKDFSREYLERVIIFSKGSIERAKTRMEKLCTFRTLMPQFFEKCNANELMNLKNYFSHSLLPKLTKDNNRIYATHVGHNKFTPELFLDSYRYCILLCEYIFAHDYCNGLIAIMDFREAQILDFVGGINLVEMQQIMTILMDGYGLRIKGIHLVTSSNTIEILVKIFKQMFSKKIGDRIHVHKTIETVHNVVPKELLPYEYGGDERSLKELQDEWYDALSLEKNVDYFKMIQNASTDEKCRLTAKFNEEHMGTPGSFKNLIVD